MMPELQVSGPDMEFNFYLLFFQATMLLAPLSAVIGIYTCKQDYFWLASLFSTPLTLYAGLGGQGLAVKIFLLTPVLLVCAGYARDQRPRLSTALVLAAFLPWVALFLGVVVSG